MNLFVESGSGYCRELRGVRTGKLVNVDWMCEAIATCI